MSKLNANGIYEMKEIDKLIAQKKTGDPESFAVKIGKSVRALYSMIKFMKSIGAPIEYSSVQKTYYYTQDGSFIISFIQEGKEPKS